MDTNVAVPNTGFAFSGDEGIVAHEVWAGFSTGGLVELAEQRSRRRHSVHFGGRNAGVHHHHHHPHQHHRRKGDGGSDSTDSGGHVKGSSDGMETGKEKGKGKGKGRKKGHGHYRSVDARIGGSRGGGVRFEGGSGRDTAVSQRSLPVLSSSPARSSHQRSQTPPPPPPPIDIVSPDAYESETFTTTVATPMVKDPQQDERSSIVSVRSVRSDVEGSDDEGRKKKRVSLPGVVHF